MDSFSEVKSLQQAELSFKFRSRYAQKVPPFLGLWENASLILSCGLPKAGMPGMQQSWCAVFSSQKNPSAKPDPAVEFPKSHITANPSSLYHWGKEPEDKRHAESKEFLPVGSDLLPVSAWEGVLLCTEITSHARNRE